MSPITASLALALAIARLTSAEVTQTGGKLTGCGLNVKPNEVTTGWTKHGETLFDKDDGSYDRMLNAQSRCSDITAGQQGYYTKTIDNQMYIVDCKTDGSVCCAPTLGKTSIPGKDSQTGKDIYTFRPC